MSSCVIQGVKGSFSSLAALKWNPDFRLIEKKTFKEVFQEVNTQADFAIIPLENSLAGSIYENYDLLQEFQVEILGEVYQKVDHCLLSTGKDLAQIEKVFSHPKALEQCERFFNEHSWMEKGVDFDTAGAADKISKNENPKQAAIASKMAGQLYGLNILKENIQDVSENYTRFALIAKKGKKRSTSNKASFLFYLRHEVGSLLKVLELFSSKQVNLTKLESRPLRQKAFEYVFYVDCIAKKQTILEELSKELHSITLQLKVLGFYKAGSL